ncbi:hypothetical protein KP509_29G044000 [Ceratopteris richardii]|uniref:Uncharacterized protein n=1 Tax=Ceratopteris richardii TaxID=49495 RepID=A0A8T2R6D1_CERRI|nr:hypothetical protein KP509_29G044000 [Ceratopteris richardii]
MTSPIVSSPAPCKLSPSLFICVETRVLMWIKMSTVSYIFLTFPKCSASRSLVLLCRNFLHDHCNQFAMLFSSNFRNRGSPGYQEDKSGLAHCLSLLNPLGECMDDFSEEEVWEMEDTTTNVDSREQNDEDRMRRMWTCTSGRHLTSASVSVRAKGLPMGIYEDQADEYRGTKKGICLAATNMAFCSSYGVPEETPLEKRADTQEKIEENDDHAKRTLARQITTEAMASRSPQAENAIREFLNPRNNTYGKNDDEHWRYCSAGNSRCDQGTPPSRRREEADQKQEQSRRDGKYCGLSEENTTLEFQASSSPIKVPRSDRLRRGIPSPHNSVDDPDVDHNEILRSTFAGTSKVNEVTKFTSERGPAPHQIADSQMMASRRRTVAFSMVDGGVGRTLKGRDLFKLRNTVWLLTGFYG